MFQAANILEKPLSDLVFETIASKLDTPGTLDRSKINLISSQNPISKRAQLIAYVNASRADGIFVILEDFDGKYREVFSTKLKFILSVEIRQTNIIVTAIDETGTGISTGHYYVIKSTASGYKNVWEGIANHVNHNYNPPYVFEVTAGINFTENGELVHSILKRVYNENNPADPVSIEKLADIYVYDENKMQYQFSKRL